MSWKLDIGVSNEILRRTRLYATMNDTRDRTVRTMAFGQAIDRDEWRMVTSRLLDLSDGETDLGRLRAALDARLSHRIAIPACLEKAFAGTTANAVSADLCRHVGIDPMRLAFISAIFARGTVRDGDRTVEIDCRKGQADRPPRASIKVRLDGRSTWSAGRFTIRRTTVPLTALQGLRGMDVDQVVDHAWEGWRGLKVTSAGINGDATIIGTDGSDAKRTMPLAA